ncbi:hypothetical protein, partial [uncultured Spongiibacter sp.]
MAGTPLEALVGPLGELDAQLSALDSGSNPLQPVLDQLGSAGGDNPLQPILDQLQGAAAGGGDNPLQPLLDQLAGLSGGAG